MAANSGILFINKVIQSENFNAFSRYGIDEDSFVSATDRKLYRFIDDYYQRNGTTPSYGFTVDNVPEFVYIPEITDRFETLAESIKDRKMAVAFNELFSEGGKFDSIKTEQNTNTDNIIYQLTSELDSIRMKYTNISTVGSSLTEYERFLAEYQERKAGKSHDVWESFMPYMTEQIGGYSSGNFYVLFAKSGRGKSVIALREALSFAMQGARVLYWGLEMDYYGIMTRLYSMLSSSLGKTVATVGGEKISAGFHTRDLKSGTLSDEFEESFESMLKGISEVIPGEIIVKSIDDPTFVDRTVRQIEADAQSTEADVVIIDPLYLMTMERNSSKTAGGDVANTSKKIRLLAGSLDVPIIGVTQSEEGDESDSGGVRELKIPKRSAVKKSKAFLEDSSAVIGMDSDYTQGRALLGLVKGREGGEGSQCELTFLPQLGLVEQLQIDAGMFDF